MTNGWLTVLFSAEPLTQKMTANYLNGLILLVVSMLLCDVSAWRPPYAKRRFGRLGEIASQGTSHSSLLQAQQQHPEQYLRGVYGKRTAGEDAPLEGDDDVVFIINSVGDEYGN